MKAKDFFRDIRPVGSSVTCNPPVLDTDRDFLILIKKEDKQTVHDLLLESGWSTNHDSAYVSSSGKQRPFISYRKKNVNYIVTEDNEHFRKFMLATKIATKFNLLQKEDRILLFNAILYGEDSTAPHEEEEVVEEEEETIDPPRGQYADTIISMSLEEILEACRPQFTPPSLFFGGRV